MILHEDELDKIPDLHYKAISYVFENNMVSNDGLWLEFGTFRGDTTRRIAKWGNGKTVYGFDSFEGLPEDWVGRTDHGCPKGTFNLGGHIPPPIENVIFIKGWFNDTLPLFLQAHPEPISFLHIDSDIYSSAKTILTLTAPRISNNSIIVFDELVEYPAFEIHEWKAWWEFVEDNNVTFEWIGGNKSKIYNEPAAEGNVFEFDRPGARWISPPCENVALRIINNPSFKESQ